MGVGALTLVAGLNANAATAVPGSPSDTHSPTQDIGSAVAGSPSSVDAGSRASVVAAYQTWLAPTLLVPVDWTGDVQSCAAGADSAASRAATVSAVNFMRALAGLPRVVLDERLSRNAQAAALIATANGTLNHEPPANSACWTKAGFLGSSKGNLSIGFGYQSTGRSEALADSTGARAVVSYMTDDGDGNEVVGHRRWILFQRLSRVGVGDTANANALQVVDAFGAPRRPVWVPWPTAGYFPRELEPNGRWSLSYPGARFNRATVTVTTPDGPAAVRLLSHHAGYGDNTLTWHVDLPAGYSAASGDYPVSVTVDNIATPGHSRVSRTWTTTLVHAQGQSPNPAPSLPSAG